MEYVPGNEQLYVFVCAGQEAHKVTRRTTVNPAPCSYCGKPFRIANEVVRQTGENPTLFEVRALKSVQV